MIVFLSWCLILQTVLVFKSCLEISKPTNDCAFCVRMAFDAAWEGIPPIPKGFMPLKETYERQKREGKE